LPFLFFSELAGLPKDLIASNSHYAGFGPGTVNIFRDMFGLPEAEWGKQEEQEQEDDLDVKRSTLSDFID
jgi:hypothetical protein